MWCGVCVRAEEEGATLGLSLFLSAVCVYTQTLPRVFGGSGFVVLHIAFAGLSDVAAAVAAVVSVLASVALFASVPGVDGWGTACSHLLIGPREQMLHLQLSSTVYLDIQPRIFGFTYMAARSLSLLFLALLFPPNHKVINHSSLTDVSSHEPNARETHTSQRQNQRGPRASAVWRWKRGRQQRQSRRRRRQILSSWVQQQQHPTTTAQLQLSSDFPRGGRSSSNTSRDWWWCVVGPGLIGIHDTMEPLTRHYNKARAQATNQSFLNPKFLWTGGCC